MSQTLTQETPSHQDLLGNSLLIEQLRKDIETVATRTGKAVLILGPTGVGKNMVAKEIHALGRRDGLFVPVNCPGLTAELAASVLFGYTIGAFTDAKKHSDGLFGVAKNGTIFLNEVGDLIPSVQALLLDVLDSGEFTRLGELRPTQSHTRVLVATNRDLRADVVAGRFREDLYHRLAPLQLHVPPLSQRRGDIPLLADFFLRKAGNTSRRFGREALASLCQQPWPGNVRELEGVVSATATFLEGDEEEIRQEDLRYLSKDAPSAQPEHLIPLQGNLPPLAEIEDAYFKALFERNPHSSIRHLAAISGASVKAVQHRKRQHNATSPS